MKKFLMLVWTCMLLATVASTPIHAQQPHQASSGPYVLLNNVYQDLGPCLAYPRVTGVLGACGQTLRIKAIGAP